MDLTDPLEFDDPDRKDLYDYVERHGSVTEREIRRALNLDQTALGHHLTVLRREGYVRKVGNHVQVAYQPEGAEVHDHDGLEVTIRAVDEDDREALTAAIRTVAEEGTYIEAETVADMLDYEDAVLRHNEVKSRLFFVAEVQDGDGTGADATGAADDDTGTDAAGDADDDTGADAAGDADDDGIAGWVHLDLPEAEKLGHTAVLTVGLVPAYRGHGIGDALLERGVEWARTHGFEKLYNSVPATNERAIGFLERRGWEVEAVREDHYKMEGEYVDEVMMAFDLRE